MLLTGWSQCSQSTLYGWREGERRLERGLVTECFIISNVAFPTALSKVSEHREPRLKRSTPLWPLGAKQLSTFFFSPSNESLCMDYVFEHSGAFYLTWFFRLHVWMRRVSLGGLTWLKQGQYFLHDKQAKCNKYFCKRFWQTHGDWGFKVNDKIKSGSGRI